MLVAQKSGTLKQWRLSTEWLVWNQMQDEGITHNITVFTTHVTHEREWSSLCRADKMLTIIILWRNIEILNIFLKSLDFTCRDSNWYCHSKWHLMPICVYFMLLCLFLCFYFCNFLICTFTILGSALRACRSACEFFRRWWFWPRRPLWWSGFSPITRSVKEKYE